MTFTGAQCSCAERRTCWLDGRGLRRARDAAHGVPLVSHPNNKILIKAVKGMIEIYKENTQMSRGFNISSG